jgi:hypothetical protein
MTPRYPATLARRCMRHAWRDSIDDRSRRLLEQASREIQRLLRELRAPQPSRN